MERYKQIYKEEEFDEELMSTSVSADSIPENPMKKSQVDGDQEDEIKVTTL